MKSKVNTIEISSNKISCVYMITNPVGQIYIGSTSNLRRRIIEYRCIGSCIGQSKISESLIKYGFESHVFECIEECSIHELKELERSYQDFYNPFGEGGLNLKKEGYGAIKSWMSNESRQKISNTKKGKPIKNRYTFPILDTYTGIFYDGIRDLSRITGESRDFYKKNLIKSCHNKTKYIYV